MGCQKNSPVTEEVAVTNKQAPVVTTKLPCIKPTTPFIKDKTKLKQMLINSGKITTNMSAEQANKIVKDYINKKRDALNRCKKEG